MSHHASRRASAGSAAPATSVPAEPAPAPPRRRPWLLVAASLLLGAWLVVLIVLAIVAG